MIPVIRSRRILENPPDYFWERVKGKEIEVIFDDGSCVLSATEIILSSYCWVFHRLDKTLPLLKSHVTRTYHKNGRPTRGMHVLLMGDILSMIQDTRALSGDRKTIYRLLDMLVTTNNDLYNAAYHATARYATASHVLDSIQLLDQKDLKDLKESLFGTNITTDSMAKAIDKSIGILTSDVRNKDGQVNDWSWMAGRNLVKPKQLSQCVFARGYVSDTNGANIDYPILDSYLTGMRSYRSFHIVARENAVAVESTQDELRKASTDSRRVTYAASYKRDISSEDCGSTDLLPYRIEDAGYLKVLAGSYITYEGKRGLIRLDKSHTHLIGKRVFIRSQFTCKHPDPGVVCHVCMGAMAETIPSGVNVGSDISKAIHQIIVQSKMSKKHLLASSVSNVSILSKLFTDIFTENKAGDIRFKDKVKSSKPKKMTISIPMESNMNMTDVYDTDNVKKLILSQMSTVRELTIHVERARSTIDLDIPMEKSGVKSVFSYPALEYINKYFKQGIELMSLVGDKYVIDFTHFDMSLPIFRRPDIAGDNDRATNDLVSLYEFTGSAKDSISANSIVDTLSDIIDKTIALDMNVSLGAIETILGAYLCRVGSHDLAKGLDDTYHAPAIEVLSNRSLSVYLMLKGQKESVVLPKAYMVTNRDDNMTDIILDPIGTLKKAGVKPTALQDSIPD